MEKPIPAQKEPVLVELEKDQSYWWCACGRSKNQPFCDGSHAGTGIEPMEYVAKRSRSLSLCACKSTGKPPFCDGSHVDLP